jgi:alkylhydroperoxidase/carboxymuconolactone decarboxylase family protein YurZ
MARIKLVSIEEAQGLVKEVFDEIESVRGKGKVSNLFRSYANFPQLLKANWEQSKVVKGGGVLSKKMKETIAIGLAVVNNCSY